MITIHSLSSSQREEEGSHPYPSTQVETKAVSADSSMSLGGWVDKGVNGQVGGEWVDR